MSSCLSAILFAPISTCNPTTIPTLTTLALGVQFPCLSCSFPILRLVTKPILISKSGGILSDRYGRKPFVAFVSFVGGVIGISVGFLPRNFDLYVVLMTLVGVSTGKLLPLSQKIVMCIVVAL